MAKSRSNSKRRAVNACEQVQFETSNNDDFIVRWHARRIEILLIETLKLGGSGIPVRLCMVVYTEISLHKSLLCANKYYVPNRLEMLL